MNTVACPPRRPGRARRQVHLACLAAVMVLLGACQGNGGEPGATGDDGDGSAGSRPAADEQLVLAERDQFDVGDTPRSRLETTEVLGSQVERVDAIKSRYDAVVTEQGETRLTVPESVLFDFDSDQLRPEGRAALDEIAEVIAFHEGAPVAIHGHTDWIGSPAYNQGLSERRAEAVRAYLAGVGGVDPARLSAVGFGETQPVASNEHPDGSDNPEGRQANRRVEIVIDT